MTVKQFLYSVRDEQKEIEELNNRICELRMSFLPGAIRYDKDRVQTSPTDSVTERMTELGDYEKTLSDKVRELTEKRNRAQKLIDSLDDSIERQVLGMYFLSIGRPRMTDVASWMHFSVSSTYGHYKAALKHLEEKTGVNCSRFSDML